MSTSAPARVLEALRTDVRGSVTAPGDAGYDAARSPFDLSADQRPAVVIEPRDADDVAAAVRIAASGGLTVTAQAGGHGAVAMDGTVALIRTTAMRGIEIDEAGRTARVEPGVRWGELHALTAPLGLHGVCGTSPLVSVTGFCLGGGISWFGRRHGYAANGVRAVELVTADGALVRVTDESDAELLRALRGGGGSFGIVTAMEIELHPAAELFGGQVMWHGAHSEAVLRAYRRWVDTVPEELTSVVTLFHVPPVPQAPAALHNQWVVWVGVAYLGGAERGRELVRPLLEVAEPLLDELGPLGIDELGRIAKEPEDGMPFHYRTQLLRDLDEDAMGVVERFAGPASDSPLLFVQVRHLGGALSRPGAAASACSHVDAPFMVYGLGAPLGGPAHDKAIRASLEAFAGAFGDRATGRAPLTFLAAGEGIERALGDAEVERLRAVKHRVDPDGVITANHPV
ncbi:MAG TPA: FAD-binding oxidoreductase [Solirubrobacteraceae bacterium]|nr:FAD-binding oxidoreductase [Solirubrobacteraceae bacterium]